MKRMIRNIFIVIVIIIFMIAFTPSYTSLNIDNLAYVVALVIDAGEVEKFKITFEFTTGSSGGESGSSSEKNPLIMNSVEASSIDSAINLIFNRCCIHLSIRNVTSSSTFYSRNIFNRKCQISIFCYNSDFICFIHQFY